LHKLARGWTLQELIAPKRVEFYTTNWNYIGEKQGSNLLSSISRASLVDEYVLGRVIEPRDVSVAKRMYWASKRKTTRIEDEAYCLLGLFGVNMPLLYGEGFKAFVRLQHEITKETSDQSILAWYCDNGVMSATDSWSYASCFAPSPRCFALSANITPLPEMDPGILGHVSFTGTLAEFTAITDTSGWGKPDDSGSELWKVILACQLGSVPGTFPTLLLRRQPDNTRHYTRVLDTGVVTDFSLHGPEVIRQHCGVPFDEPLGLAVRQSDQQDVSGLSVEIIGGGKYLPYRIYLTLGNYASELHKDP
jgi:hypothetical protein